MCGAIGSGRGRRMTGPGLTDRRTENRETRQCGNQVKETSNGLLTTLASAYDGRQGALGARTSGKGVGGLTVMNGCGATQAKDLDGARRTLVRRRRPPHRVPWGCQRPREPVLASRVGYWKKLRNPYRGGIRGRTAQAERTI